MKIERAHKVDATELTELTIRSKDYWNYGEKQIEEWREELTITPKYVEENHVYKGTKKGMLMGFYAYNPENSKNVKLNFLFVAPEFIGHGCGKILMTDFLRRIEKKGYEKVVLDADPNAEKFYERMGFKAIGKLKSSIEGRFLPIMELKMKTPLGRDE
ncbi:MAG: GNAT family N-acetyltransferase [Flavobacteriaceae bacterium]